MTSSATEAQHCSALAYDTSAYEIARSDRYRHVLNQALTAADDLVRRTSRTAPPFSPYAYADLCKSAVYEAALLTSGRLLPGPDDTYAIEVNEKEPAVRRRFTMCHEIGHVLFEETVRFPGEATWPMQSEADYFIEELVCERIASELLMPRAIFTTIARAYAPTLEAVVKLAAMFEVSFEAAIIRISQVAPWPTAAVIRWHRVRDGAAERRWSFRIAGRRSKAITRNHLEILSRPGLSALRAVPASRIARDEFVDGSVLESTHLSLHGERGIVSLFVVSQGGAAEAAAQ